MYLPLLIYGPPRMRTLEEPTPIYVKHLLHEHCECRAMLAANARDEPPVPDTTALALPVTWSCYDESGPERASTGIPAFIAPMHS